MSKTEAAFTAEFKIENITYAALHYCMIAKGVITKIDVSEAEQANGIIKIIAHENSYHENQQLYVK